MIRSVWFYVAMSRIKIVKVNGVKRVEVRINRMNRKIYGYKIILKCIIM